MLAEPTCSVAGTAIYVDDTTRTIALSSYEVDGETAAVWLSATAVVSLAESTVIAMLPDAVSPTCAATDDTCAASASVHPWTSTLACATCGNSTGAEACSDAAAQPVNTPSVNTVVAASPMPLEEAIFILHTRLLCDTLEFPLRCRPESTPR